MSQSEIDRLVAEPEGLETLMYGPRPIPTTPPRGGLIGFLKRLSPITIEQYDGPPPVRPNREVAGGGVSEIDLDKAWHGLQFLFTGTAWDGDEPACFLVRGGADIGDDEIGNSIPRLIRPTQVREFAAFLGALSPAELERRYDPKRMTALEIYPERIWTDESAAREYVLEAFDELRTFASAAAAHGDGLIIHLS